VIPNIVPVRVAITSVLVTQVDHLVSFDKRLRVDDHPSSTDIVSGLAISGVSTTFTVIVD
jgi:hypothetical protein